MSAENDDQEMIIDTSQMSEGKRQALEMAEDSRDELHTHRSLVASYFMGKFPTEGLYPFKRQPQEDAEEAQVFLDQLETFIAEKVDADRIDEEGEIPDEIIQELGAMGAFGIKVKKEYGGLGLSQTTYCRAAQLLGSVCGNLTALLSAHQSIGVAQPLVVFGSEEQKKKYLPRVAGGEISAFALTEDGVGSDPARMTTEAVPSEDGSHYILNGKKLWCTNGVKAGVIVVMAKTPQRMVRGKLRDQISAFIVEMDSPGVNVDLRCHFMGLRALYNGVISFTDVKVPAENLIGKEGKGLKIALTTLNTGRLTIPAACIGLNKRCIEVSRKWAAEREQWGSAIGQHAAIADKIGRMTVVTYAMEAMIEYTAGLVDRKEGDIRLEAAVCKMWGTEESWKVVDETLQIRGGRGYEVASSLKARGEDPVAVERWLRDSRINMIFEGSSEIMRLFIAREALDPHLKVGGAVMNSRLPLGKRVAAALKAGGFYALWYPSLFLPRWVAVGGMDSRLAGHMHWGARCSRRLARQLFHAMLRYGPALEREQIVLKHLVDIGADLFMLSVTCARAAGGKDEGEIALADTFAGECRNRIEERFMKLKRNKNKAFYRLAQEVLEGKMRWMEQGIVRSK